MPKKSHHHSIHFSTEVQDIADANMKTVEALSLNGYMEMLVRGHNEFLRKCTACHDREVADSFRVMLIAAQKAGPVPWRE